MYIITERGHKSKPEVYEDKDLLMFDTTSDYVWKVYTKDNRELMVTKIEKREVVFEAK